MNLKRREVLTMLAAGAWAFPLLGRAQSSSHYPVQDIRLIVPYPPGGPSDVIGRMVAAQLQSRLGRPVLVDNRAGANGIIGSGAVAAAEPDGYTLLLATAANSSNPSIYESLPFDTEKAFSPVSLVAASPMFVWAREGLEANSMHELIELAKAHPGKLTFASSGIGGTPHLAGEMLKQIAGVELLHVPYKGTAPAITDLVAGRVDLYIGGMATTDAHYRAGRLKVLGVAEPERSSLMPEVPSVVEQGLPEYSFLSWFGLFAPAGSPPAALETIATALQESAKSPGFENSLNKVGMTPRAMTPNEFEEFFKEDMALWRRIIQTAEIKAE